MGGDFTVDNEPDKKPAEVTAATKTTEPGSGFATPEPHDKQSTPRLKALSGALLILVSLAAGFLGGWVGANSNDNAQNSLASSQRQVISSESNLINSIAKDAGPSVVSVDVIGQAEGGGNSFFDYYGGGQRTSKSAGTGIIIASNGLIVTNRHVVPNGTTDVDVTLSDGTELTDVKVIGRTRDTDPLDVAFLKIEDAKGKKLTAAKIGDSSKVQVGDKVVAIGNALGQFQNTVTSGIISARLIRLVLTSRQLDGEWRTRWMMKNESAA